MPLEKAFCPFEPEFMDVAVTLKICMLVSIFKYISARWYSAGNGMSPLRKLSIACPGAPMTSVTVYRASAFVDLALEIRRFGALLRTDAERLFGCALVSHALKQRVCGDRPTKAGAVLFLLHFGRKLTGLAGAFTPTDDGLLNALCLRDAATLLESHGVTIDLEFRKRSLVFETPEKRVLVLAQHDGYAMEALRRMHKSFVKGGEFDQMQLYTYMDPQGLAALTGPLYNPPRSSQPVPINELQVYTLPLPTTSRILTLPAGAT